MQAVNWVDLAVGLLLLEAAVAGWRRGLLAMAVRAAGLAAGAVAGWLYSPQLAQVLNERYHAAYYLQRWLTRRAGGSGEMPDYLAVGAMGYKAAAATLGEWLLVGIAFVLILAAAGIGISLLGALLCRGLEGSGLAWWNRLAGGGAALGVRVLFLSVVCVLLEPLVYFWGAPGGEMPPPGSAAFYFSSSHFVPCLKAVFAFCWTALAAHGGPGSWAG